MPVEFSKNFLWGTATSPHQTEGNNLNSDWWHWELDENAKNKPIEPSGIACDSYNRFEEDFEFARQAHNNAIRIGIEWARIEPEDGKYDFNEIRHYRKVLTSAKKKGLKVFLTLHHFTSPLWTAKQGGWLNPKTSIKFSKYAGLIASELGDLVEAFITINEPQVYAAMAYLVGKWYPAKKNIIYSGIVQVNFWLAHIKAQNEIKKISKDFKVGIAKHIVYYRVSKESKLKFFDKIITGFLNFLNSDFYLIPIRKYMDFIGVNFYFTTEFKHMKTHIINDRVSDLNWWLEPSGISKVLLSLKKYNLPIYITENGLADKVDLYRTWWIKEILLNCHDAILQGVDLRGYFHWSLVDNFEWHHGYTPRFGLIEIDRENNLARIPRSSYYEYARICKSCTIE